MLAYGSEIEAWLEGFVREPSFLERKKSQRRRSSKSLIPEVDRIPVSRN